MHGGRKLRRYGLRGIRDVALGPSVPRWGPQLWTYCGRGSLNDSVPMSAIDLCCAYHDACYGEIGCNEGVVRCFRNMQDWVDHDDLL